MRKIISTVFIIVLIAANITACAGTGPEPDKQTAADAKGSKLRIYTSFYPMYYIVKKIGGDRAEVISMVPAGAEPHDWEPTVRTIRDMRGADMFIYNGAGMETWVDKILQSIDRNKVKVVEASRGIELLGADPHVWVSPRKLKQEAQNVLNALTEIDPGNKDYYAGNYRELSAKLDKLDSDITSSVKTFKSNVFVVSHEAFGYFAHDYNLVQIPIRGVNPEDEPSPAEMARLVEECRKNNIKYIFSEKLVSPKLSESLANEVNARILILNDAAGLSEEDMKNGKDYISVMYENLENLKKALMYNE